MVERLPRDGIHILYYYSLVWDVAVAAASIRNGAARYATARRSEAPGRRVAVDLHEHALPGSGGRGEQGDYANKYEVDGAWFDILKQTAGRLLLQMVRRGPPAASI